MTEAKPTEPARRRPWPHRGGDAGLGGLRSPPFEKFNAMAWPSTRTRAPKACPPIESQMIDYWRSRAPRGRAPGDHEAWPPTARGLPTGRGGILRHRRGDTLVAVEAVAGAAGLLRVHEVGVQSRVFSPGALDRFLRDFVEDHAAHGKSSLQDLREVPRDGLTLAVLISCQIEFVDLEGASKFGDLSSYPGSPRSRA